MDFKAVSAFDAVDSLVIDNPSTVTVVVNTTVVDAQNLTVYQTFDLSHNGTSANTAMIQTSGDTHKCEVDTVDGINGIEKDTGAIDVTSTLLTKPAQTPVDEHISIEPAVCANIQLGDTIEESTVMKHPNSNKLRNTPSEEAAIADVLGANMADIRNCGNFFLGDANFGTSSPTNSPKVKLFLGKGFDPAESLSSNLSKVYETAHDLSTGDTYMVSGAPDLPEVPGAFDPDFDTSADDSSDLPEFPSARKEVPVPSGTAQRGKSPTHFESLFVEQDTPTFLFTSATHAALVASGGKESLFPEITNSLFNSNQSGDQSFYAAPSASKKDPLAIYNWTSVNSDPKSSNAQVLSLKRKLANPVTSAAKKQVVADKKSQLFLNNSDTPQGSPTNPTPSAPLALKTPVGSFNGGTVGGIDFDLTNHPYRSYCGAHLPGPMPLIPALRPLQGTVYIHTLQSFVNTVNININKDPVNAKAMLTKAVNNYIPIVCAKSDGVHDQPDASLQSAIPDATGKIIFYWPCRGDSYQAISWKKTLGKYLAVACEAHMPNEYILKEFPKDYALWERISGKVDANNTIISIDRTDRYLYGYGGGPGTKGRCKYASPQEFFPHLLWLGTDLNGEYKCTCHLCNRVLEVERLRRKAEKRVHDRVQFAIEKWNNQHQAIIAAKEKKNVGGGGY